jgi:hypothetical protein
MNASTDGGDAPFLTGVILDSQLLRVLYSYVWDNPI